jgi:sensor histidine kinase YesM
VRLGKIDSAMIYFNKVVLYGKGKNDNNYICKAKLEIGRAYIRNNDFTNALNTFFAILKISEKEQRYNYLGAAKTNIGFVYLSQKRVNDALPFFLDAEKKLLAVKDTVGLFGVYSYLPVCIGMTGDTARAINYFQRGFDLYDAYEESHPITQSEREILDRNRMVQIYNRLDYLLNEEELNKDLKRAEMVWGHLKNGTDTAQQFELLTILANLSLSLKKYKQAIKYAEQAILLYDGKKYNQITDIYWLIAQASGKTGQYEKAYQSLLLFRKYNDSLFNVSQLEAINSVEAKYQVQNKEQEINALQKQERSQRIITALAIGGLILTLGFSLLVIRSGKLRRKLLLKEKDIEKTKLEQKMSELEQVALRAQMNPHFIFNCLNSVQRYVINNDVKGVNSYLSTFASLIRQTLENSGKSLVSLKDELKYLETYICVEKMRSSDNFEYEIIVDDDIDTASVGLPGMIIQPFVENSILHGIGCKSEKGGVLKLTIVKKEQLIFVVEDNGPGIKNQDLSERNYGKRYEPRGGSITAKRIEIYNNLHEEKIEFSITDKVKTATGESGTRVRLAFPIIYI